MTEWREMALGEALDVLHGYAFKGEHFRGEGEHVLLTPGNFIDTGGFKPKSGREKYYDGPFPPEYLLQGGDVVIAMTEQAYGLLGSSATIPCDNRYLHNQRLGLLRVTNSKLLELRFAYHLMNTPDVRSQIQATATGSKVRHTAPERIRGVTVKVPSPGTQRIIAKVLDSINDLIASQRKRTDCLAEMSRTIYREWFVHFRYPGHAEAAWVESSLGPIPDGWEVQPFAAIASFVNGFAFKPNQWGDEGRPIIKIKQLKQGVANDTPRCEEGSVALKYWIEPGDLLFSWSADLGVYRWSDEPGLLNQHLFLVIPAKGLSRSFLLHALDGAMPQFWDRAQGTTMRHIKRSALSEVVIKVPGTELIARFTSAVAPMEREVIVLEQIARNLVVLRDLLLPKLVTGQIDVSTLDLDALVEESVA